MVRAVIKRLATLENHSHSLSLSLSVCYLTTRQLILSIWPFVDGRMKDLQTDFVTQSLTFYLQFPLRHCTDTTLTGHN